MPAPPSSNPPCPHCGHRQTRTRGFLHGQQQYSCRACGRFWRGVAVDVTQITLTTAEALTLGRAWYLREGQAPRTHELAAAGLVGWSTISVLFGSLTAFQRLVEQGEGPARCQGL